MFSDYSYITLALAAGCTVIAQVLGASLGASCSKVAAIFFADGMHQIILSLIPETAMVSHEQGGAQ